MRAAIAPGFTLDLMANHSLDFWLTWENLPEPENRDSYVVDGGFFERGGQTALTIMANTLRVGDYLMERMNKWPVAESSLTRGSAWGGPLPCRTRFSRLRFCHDHPSTQPGQQSQPSRAIHSNRDAQP